MKIAILSDSHDHIPLLRAAGSDAIAAGAEVIIHCGDLVAPSTLNCLKEMHIPVHVIHGNNTGDLVTLSRLTAEPDNLIHYYGQDVALTLGDKQFFLVHYPHYARAMALTGDYDIVCCGHSHKVSIETLTDIHGDPVRCINPGTVGGVGSSPATWILADLEKMTFDVQNVDKAIEFRSAVG
jgi:putative phosphoesterase